MIDPDLKQSRVKFGSLRFDDDGLSQRHGPSKANLVYFTLWLYLVWGTTVLILPELPYDKKFKFKSENKLDVDDDVDFQSSPRYYAQDETTHSASHADPNI
eukprot:scaffold198694_cov53-Attheya_sp.AAC.1